MLGSWVRAPGGSPNESFAKDRWNSCCFCMGKTTLEPDQKPLLMGTNAVCSRFEPQADQQTRVSPNAGGTLAVFAGGNNARTGPKTLVDGNKHRLFAIRAPGGSPDESFAKRRWNSCCFYRVTGFQTSRPSVFRLSTTPSGARSDRHATVESTLFRARCAAFAADGGSYDLVLYGIFGIFVECRIDLCLLIHLVESDFRQRIENLFVFCHIISKNCCTFAGEFTPKPCYAAEGVDSLHIDGVY